jgi:hypothetical protein
MTRINVQDHVCCDVSSMRSGLENLHVILDIFQAVRELYEAGYVGGGNDRKWSSYCLL